MNRLDVRFANWKDSIVLKTRDVLKALTRVSFRVPRKMLLQKEFVKLIMEDQKKPDEREADTMLAFRIFDADNKGYVDSAELRYILLNMDKRIPTEELNELIVIADLERDRKISYQEFLALVECHGGRFT
ncbi:calmodulin-like [Montipora capricornis]|uniref:calmodulin-like n=1 Tax=Montipora foliosa TaxID=591990 RepID=UPI0035F19D38